MTTMLGPYRLERDEIEDVVAIGWPGVYSLGYVGPNEQFYVTYVGSSYSDLASELVQKIGTANMFKVARCADAQSAFELVCAMYHRFRPFGNFLHPERPRGERWVCPNCSPQELPPSLRSAYA